MKRFLFSTIIVLFGSILIATNTFANKSENNSDIWNEEQKLLIQNAHEEMLELVKEGVDDTEIKNGYYYKQLESLFELRPDLKEDYIKNLDVYNDVKVQEKLIDLDTSIIISSFSLNESYRTEDYVVFDDGSFMKIIIEDYPALDLDTLMVSPLVVQNFGNRTTSHKSKIYHLAWFDGVIQLNTKYNLSKSGIKITGTDKSGTTATFPSSVVGSTSIEIKSATKKGAIARSKGSFTYTIGGYNGIGLITIHPLSRTTYTLNKINSKSVDYKIKNTFNKGT